MKIRSDILRVYQALHTWVGIGAGMLLFIGFFAGALTMFAQPIERWIARPAAHAVAVSPGPELDRLVRAVLAQQPVARDEFTLDLTEESGSAPVSWSAGDSARELDLKGRRWTATLDASGRLRTSEVQPSLLARLIDMLHRTAGIPGTLGGEQIGVYAMGVAGIMYFLALVSGVILLLPTLVKDFLVLRAGKNRKRFWLDAHNVIGIASLPYHIVISLTVIVFAFHDQFYGGIARIVYGPQPMWQMPPAAPPHAVADMLPATQLVRLAGLAAPEFAVTEVMFMGLETPRPRIRAAIASPRHLVQGATSGYVILDPYSGGVIDNSMVPGSGKRWSSIVAPFFALHFGSYGGNLVRWVYFVFGMSGAVLFYSGNLLWLEKRRRNQGRAQAPVSQARTSLRMAALSVGVCTGAMIGVASAMVAGKWLAAYIENINFAYLAVYYTGFLGALGWAFWRGAARASVDLLYASALAAMAIPATTLVALAAPGLGPWASTSPAALGVDATAGALALLLAWMARKTSFRAMHGPADSVWSGHEAGRGGIRLKLVKGA